MPSLDTQSSYETIKALYIGDSGSGKTGSLVSLVEAGYKLRILDLDAGIGILKQFVMQKCPDKLGSISYQAYRDKTKPTPGGITLSSKPVAFINSMAALDKWPDDESSPSEWGPEYIFVVDSLTALGKAAYNWFDHLNPGVKDKRQVFNLAQNALDDFLYNVTSEDFRSNVLIISHITYNETETKGHVSAIGKALGPKIPRHFNNLILAESKGQGDKVRRTIRTVPTGVVDTKLERPFDVPSELPLETGLATLFKLLKG